MTAPSMAGKACLVTGGNSGIGYVTARELARSGARVVLVGRDPARCASARDRVRAETGSDLVEFLIADLSNGTDVRRLAEEYRAIADRLDVLVNNAGAMFLSREEAVDGLEMTFALNHMAYFRLTTQLLDLLKASAPSRIVNVASESYRGMKLNFEDLQSRRRYHGYVAYGRSKLANLYFTFELARRLRDTGVTANALHPGFVRTSFFEGNGVLGWLTRRVASIAAISPEDGAKTPLHLAVAPELTDTTGEYFIKSKSVRPSASARDEQAAHRLWLESESLLG